MIDIIWKLISSHLYIIVAIPCMSFFSFRFEKKYRFPLLIATIILACIFVDGIEYVTDAIFQGDFRRFGFLWHQTLFIIVITAACCFLYKGHRSLMLLTVCLSVSLAGQCGGVFGGFLSLYKEETTIGMLILRDILGYGAYAVFYFVQWKYLHLSDLYLTQREHAILIGASFVNFLLTCSFVSVFTLGNPSSIPFYAACMLTTFSITFLISLFAKEHEKVQNQQILIYEMRVSENMYAQMKETVVQMRQLKHELSNYFIYAQRLLENRDYENLAAYISGIIESDLPIADTISTNNAVVNAIVNQKNTYAKSLNIRTDFSVVLPEQMEIDNLTLCTIFGNLLNNAIEACKDQKDAFIKMDVRPVKNYLIFRVDNSVLYDVLKENPYLFTTKGDVVNHGNGIQILKKIVEKRDGVLHYEMAAPDCFSMQLMLKLYN